MDVQTEVRRRGNQSVVFCAAEFKAEREGDTFTELSGLASTFTEDLQGDVIHRGAFTKTVKERVPAGRVPLLDSHIWSAGHTIGTVKEASETEEGLQFRASLARTPDAQDIACKVHDGHLRFTSIGFQIIKCDFEEERVEGSDRPKITRNIRELKLFEVSVVPIPANEGARIDRVKSLILADSVDELLYRAALGDVDEDRIANALIDLSKHLGPDALASARKSLDLSVSPCDMAEQKSAEPSAPGSRVLTLTGGLKVSDPRRRNLIHRLNQARAQLSDRTAGHGRNQ